MIGVMTTARREPGKHDLDCDIILDLLSAIAEREQVDPLDLTPPLAEQIRPDALQRLLDGPTPVQVTFEYQGYRIQVQSVAGDTIYEINEAS